MMLDRFFLNNFNVDVKEFFTVCEDKFRDSAISFIGIFFSRLIS